MNEALASVSPQRLLNASQGSKIKAERVKVVINSSCPRHTRRNKLCGNTDALRHNQAFVIPVLLKLNAPLSMSSAPSNTVK